MRKAAEWSVTRAPRDSERSELDFVRFLFGFGAEDEIHNLVCYVQAGASSLNYNFSRLPFFRT